jgi:TalC/MipB family fructose-6-phosphate aldolase
MEKKVYDAYVQILEAELLKALGCTEPGAVAFTAAKAVEVLGKKPERMEVNSSGNIIKNVKGVIVPNSGGLRGIAPAAILGALVAKPELELEILEGVTDAERAEAKELLAKPDYCKSTVEEGEGNLYVEVTVWAGDDNARVIIRNNHTNIVLIEKNGEAVQSGAALAEGADIAELKKLMSLEGIIEFAKTCDLNDVKAFLDQQIECNNAIGEEGLKATMALKKLGIGVTMTAIFTPAQALLAAMAGASFVAPYVNRLDNILGDGTEVVESIVNQLQHYGSDCQVLAASFKNAEQVHRCANAGCHSVTVSASILKTIISHPMTDNAVAGFERDWAAVYGDKTIKDF